MVAERKQEAGEKAAGTRAHSFLRQRKENELTIRFPAVIFKSALGLNLKTRGLTPGGWAAGNHPAALSLQPDFSAVGK